VKVCTYVMTSDTGLAPNPFYGYCTLALCTPNHRGARLNAGDWIAGFYTRTEEGGLVYAMRICEVMRFDEYYRDKRFAKKQPSLSGPWKRRVGDAMYFLNESEEWERSPEATHHTSSRDLEKDTKHPLVFIAKEFYYFGCNRKEVRLPRPASAIERYWLCRKRCQGTKYFREEQHPREVSAFVAWLQLEGRKITTSLPCDAPRVDTARSCGTRTKQC
jgi:putative DNA base modification enzyme with NMAD domain